MIKPIKNQVFSCLCTTLILLSIMAIFNCSSSKKSNGNATSAVESILKNKKESIVQMAREVVKKDIGKNIPETYETKVFANDSSIIVFFDIPIKFARKNSAFYYFASVDLISNSTTYQPIVNTENELDASQHFPFYRPSKEDEALVEFVFNANNEANASYKKQWQESIVKNKTLTIVEGNSFFDVKSLTQTQSTRFKVDKKTGAISEKSHRHIKTQSLIDQGYSEIK